MRLPFVPIAVLWFLPDWAQAQGLLQPADGAALGLGLLGVLGVLALLAALGWATWAGRRTRQLALQLRQQRTELAEVAAQAQGRLQAQQIAVHMQQAGSPEALGQALLAGLAPLLGLGAGLLARWDADRGELRPLARWAGAGADLDAASAASLGLMRECARQASPVVLQGGQTEGLRIQSGLGAMPPRTLVLQPVRQGGLVHAVLELASTRAWTEADHRLLAELEPQIALGLALQTRAQRGVLGGADQKDQWLMDAPCALTAQDAAGELHFGNRAFAQLIGLEPSQSLPSHLRSSWADLERLQEFLHQAAQQAELRGFAAQLLRHDGRRVPVLIDAHWSVHEGRRSLVAAYRPS